MNGVMTQQKRDERKKFVHPKFVERWARRYLEVQRTQGRGAAIRTMNSFLNPDDALEVGRAARRLQETHPSLRPKEPA